MRREYVLVFFSLLLLVLSLLYPGEILNYPRYIDWKTIVALSGLLIIVTGFKESKVFEITSHRIIDHLKTEKHLAMSLIILTVFLSTFLTNDISLFIVVPLTLELQRIVKNDISKLVIFEAIASNVGSALTPIGNPQNLYLWHNWGISFLAFTLKMSPLVLFLLITLLGFAWFSFNGEEIQRREINDKSNRFSGDFNRKLAVLSSVMLLIYILSLELRIAVFILPLILLVYLLYDAKILFKVDWALLLLFAIIFIDFHLISSLPVVSKAITSVNLINPANLFLISVIASQVVSNVPASVLISHFSHNWLVISYGVNLGGNGLLISSLANLITIRIAGNSKVLRDFHKYSLPYLIFTGIVAYVAIKILM